MELRDSVNMDRCDGIGENLRHVMIAWCIAHVSKATFSV